MIKNCILCGNSTKDAILCEDCRWSVVMPRVRGLPSEVKDVYFSAELGDAAWTIWEQYGFRDNEDIDLWYIVCSYMGLIVVGLKSEAALRGILVTEGKLKPDKAKTLAHDLMSLYF